MWLLLIRRAACEGLGRASQPHGSFCPSFYFWKNNALIQIETQIRKAYFWNKLFLSKQETKLAPYLDFPHSPQLMKKAYGGWHLPGIHLRWIKSTGRPGGKRFPSGSHRSYCLEGLSWEHSRMQRWHLTLPMYLWQTQPSVWRRLVQKEGGETWFSLTFLFQQDSTG